jgi:hypothetical protein
MIPHVHPLNHLQVADNSHVRLPPTFLAGECAISGKRWVVKPVFFWWFNLIFGC